MKNSRLRVLAPPKPLQLGEECGAILRDRRYCRWHKARTPALNVLHAVFRHGMIIKDAEPSLVASLAGHIALKTGQDIGQSCRGIARLRRSADSDAVSFPLLSAAVRAQPGSSDRVDGGIDQGAQ